MKQWKKHQKIVIYVIITSKFIFFIYFSFLNQYYKISMTAIDNLGRMENEYAYSAANAFKFDQWHSMFMPKQHDITKLTYEELKDVYTLAWKWYE